MFSIQVLSRALEVFGLRAVPYRSPEPEAAAARADPASQHGFICNLMEHWLTIRSIHGQARCFRRLAAAAGAVAAGALALFFLLRLAAADARLPPQRASPAALLAAPTPCCLVSGGT